jgi:hypothetical protein
MAPAARAEILTVADSSRWAEVLEEIGRHDFCHLPAYSNLAEISGHGRAAMFAYREGEHVLAFPLLFRKIEAGSLAGIAGAWEDVTSVYGYAGPLAASQHTPGDVCARFMAWIADYFREHRVVSALSRMHPLLTEQAPLLSGFGVVAPVGWTLSLDLTLPEEEQTAGYRRNHRQDIKRLRSMGVTCEEVGPERLGEFVDIYYENMDRVKASSEYYFSADYFAHLYSDMPGVTHLFMCQHQNRAVAAGIFTICHSICQWYLSGSRAGFHGPPPTKLMFDEARRWARACGARILHLGGGVGGSRDSLYHFKRGFTQREHIYSIWKYVVNQPVYDDLSRAMCELYGVAPGDGYFPLYRHPAFQRSAVDADSDPTGEQIYHGD